MERVESISEITRQFDTGDRPILVCCSDRNDYLCKYNRFGGAAEALTREYIGTSFANAWSYWKHIKY